MLTIDNFNEPTEHPYELLQGYSQAGEKETVLMLLLQYCYAEGDLYAAKEFQYSHPTMVEDGLLEEVGERTYKLTKKSIGLLYSVYGKDNTASK